MGGSSSGLLLHIPGLYRLQATRASVSAILGLLPFHQRQGPGDVGREPAPMPGLVSLEQIPFQLGILEPAALRLSLGLSTAHLSHGVKPSREEIGGTAKGLQKKSRKKNTIYYCYVLHFCRLCLGSISEGGVLGHSTQQWLQMTLLLGFCRQWRKITRSPQS